LLKAILVDDEVLALNLLEAMLKELSEVEIIGKFLNPIEAVEKAKLLKPDILFLDIEMPQMSGMKVAEELENIHEIEIVFITAYEQFALEAFHVQAVDYMLKPIEKERLRRTVERIRMRKKPFIPSEVPPPSLQTNYLGSFILTDLQGQPFKWRTKKVKELCAYLMYLKEPVHRYRIMEDLWPGQSIDKTTAILHTSVYQLRKIMKESGFIESVLYIDERYSIVVPSQSDLDEINSLLHQSQLTYTEVQRLLSLYRDDFLAEEDYPWAVSKREKLRKTIIKYLKSYLDIAHETNGNSLYKECLTKLLELEPWNEQYAEKLIHYHIESENYSEAKTFYQQFKESLWQHLGIKPTTLQEIENIIG